MRATKAIKISFLSVYVSKVINGQLDSWNNFFQGFLIPFLKVLTLEKSQICCSASSPEPIANEANDDEDAGDDFSVDDEPVASGSDGDWLSFVHRDKKRE